MKFEGMQFTGEELEVIFNGLEVNKLVIGTEMKQDYNSIQMRGELQAEQDIVHSLMVRIAEYWARKERWELNTKADALFKEWQDMSVAKSNGACRHMSISQVFAYDDKMVAPLNKARELRAQAMAITPRYK